LSYRFRIKIILMSSGERLPVIVDSSGQPLFSPTIYVLTEIRGRNRASQTIEGALRSLLVLLLFLNLRKIPLEHRLDSGQIIDLGEIEELVRICRLQMKRLNEIFDASSTERVQVGRVISLEKYRSGLRGAAESEIKPSSAASRLRYIRDYLVWKVNERLLKHGVDTKYRSTLDSARQLVVNAIDARLPSGNNRGSLEQREGLDPDVSEKILKIIDPQSPENPWHDDHCRYRNALIIRWLNDLGPRRGEILNIRISDIDFRKSTVTVARRADDITDPRKYQPKVKTLARIIPVSPELLDMTREYIINQRAAVKGAKKHDFLIVASDSGAPLSIVSVDKVFKVLRAKCPDLPRSLAPHILRHTWNDRYSEIMDKNKVQEDEEKKTRSYLMGWSETSGTAATYTRRHIREKAQKASLEMQNTMIRKGEDR
jgi:integrase